MAHTNYGSQRSKKPCPKCNNPTTIQPNGTIYCLACGWSLTKFEMVAARCKRIRLKLY